MASVLKCIETINVEINRHINGSLSTVSGRAEEYATHQSKKAKQYRYATFFLSEMVEKQIHKIKVFIPEEMLITLEKPIGGGQIVEVEGTLSIYAGFLQIRAKKITVLKEVQRGNIEPVIRQPKKILPRIIKSIAIITSEQGSVYQDVEKNIKYGEIELFQARMEGGNSVSDIISQIENINVQNRHDVICIIRGGAGKNDSSSYLAFNSRQLANAIQNSNIPVLTAIGHDENTFLCDHVSDNPEPFSTPTALAKHLAQRHDLLLLEAENKQKYVKATNDFTKGFPYQKAAMCLIALYVIYRLFLKGTIV